MKTSSPQTIYLKDYTPPSFLVENVKLFFDIKEEFTEVTAESDFKKNPKSKDTTLRLNGDFFELVSLSLNDKKLTEKEYTIKDSILSLDLPDAKEFTLKTVTRIEPSKNTNLEGLYQSGDILCTQNEAEGFRRITYFLDRPDVMASYTTTIEADQQKYPHLLSNGNCTLRKTLPNGRHRVTWVDPHKKPCYLFALVAGDFGLVEGQFTTKSGKEVLLQIFVDKGQESRAEFALASLERAMKWDEERFGLEYDLDVYMIVAVSSFNAGAMENKGLNIFNSKYVLADPKTSTDHEYIAIESVIGHEYFHNWTGNRVTCRDWFQLSLKEGLTVYRDQEFTADLHSRSVKRIEDVSALRSSQFSEDAGPMAHPVRPSSYMAVNNFYTSTVYIKGAEVVRMVETLIGRENFRKGIDKYFELFDGQAVTTEDFIHAMEVASGKDLTQFKLWYEQSGTPEVRYELAHNPENQTVSLTLTQSCPPTPGQTEKKPFHLPLAVGFIGSGGEDLSLKLQGEKSNMAHTTKVIELTEAEQTFVFEGLAEKPVLSLLRGFSAPVNIANERSFEELIFLMKHDSDEFNRWDAGQKVVIQWIKDSVAKTKLGEKLELSTEISDSFKEVLASTQLDDSFKALMIQLPDLKYLAQFLAEIDPYALKEARDFLISSLAKNHQALLHDLYNKAPIDGDFSRSGSRQLKNTILQYLASLDHQEVRALALRQFDNPSMTLKLGALKALNLMGGNERVEAMHQFYKEFKSDTVTIDKWLVMNALYEGSDWKKNFDETLKDTVFDPLVPNKCYSLLVAFGSANTRGFHHPEGVGYKLIADWVISIDKSNPQVAARLMSVFNPWRKMETGRQGLMKSQIERVVQTEGLSSNTYEIASKALQ